MRTHLYVALLTVFALAGRLNAQNSAEDLDITRFVVLELSGEVAKEYSRLTNCPVGKDREGQPTTSQFGVVTRRLENGMLRIKHSSELMSEQKNETLVTLTVTVKPSELDGRTTPAGTLVYSSDPFDKRPRKLESDTTTHYLPLSKLSDVDLRVWKSSSEQSRRP